MKKSKLIALIASSLSAQPADATPELETEHDVEPIDLMLTPLNEQVSPLLAAHTSHRSHSSHSSHRSSSTGTYRSPRTPRLPPPPPPDVNPPAPKAAPNGTQPPRPLGAIPRPKEQTGETVSSSNPAQRVKLIKRVQLILKLENMYTGALDGQLGSRTREAIRRWQGSKGIMSDKYLDAETLSSMGILAY